MKHTHVVQSHILSNIHIIPSDSIPAIRNWVLPLSANWYWNVGGVCTHKHLYRVHGHLHYLRNQRKAQVAVKLPLDD